MRDLGRQIRGFVRRDLLEALTYKSNLVTRFVGVLAFLLIAWFTAQTFAGREPSEITRYGGYFAFLLFGLVMADASWALMAGPAARVRQAQLAGTLEVVLGGRLGAERLMLIEALGAGAAAALRAVIYIGGAAALFGLPFHVTDPLAAGLSVVLSAAALAPVGLVGASVTLVLKRADPFGRMVHGLSMLAGGVIYPRAVLPAWLAALGEALPPTHALRALRGAWLAGQDVAALRGSLLALAALAVGGGLLAAVALRAADRLARRLGTLGHY